MSIHTSWFEVEVQVDYDFSPPEEAVMYGDDAYPGCSEDITINSVMCDGIDLLPILTASEIERVKSEISELENTPPDERIGL